MILETQRGSALQFIEVASVTFSPEGVFYTTAYNDKDDVVRAYGCTVAHQSMDVIQLYTNGLKSIRVIKNAVLSWTL